MDAYEQKINDQRFLIETQRATIDQLQAKIKRSENSQDEDVDIIEGYVGLTEKLQAKNEEQEELIDRLCSQEPCPKCGYGVTGACYGCEIKKLRELLSQAQEYIRPKDPKFLEIEQVLKDK